MKQKIKSAAFMLSLVAFTQANALPGIFCPNEDDLRRVVSQNLASLTSLQPFTLTIQSQDGQSRTWEVRNPQFYLPGSFANSLPLQENDPLFQRVNDIVNQNRIFMDYDMRSIPAEQQQSARLRAQNPTWCLVQFKNEDMRTNTLAFHLSLPKQGK